ncbi:hypothetical protein [Corynebacterium sp. 20_84]
MDVKEIITHLENFANTWKGWGDFLGGLVKFFGTDGILDSINTWKGAGNALEGLFGSADK